MVAVAVVPLADAVIVANPPATAVTANVPVVEPAATVTEAGTVATLVLLLGNVTIAPADVVKVIVPCDVAPGTMLAGLNERLPTLAGAGGGAVGLVLLLPHCTVASGTMTSSAAAAAKQVPLVFFSIQIDHEHALRPIAKTFFTDRSLPWSQSASETAERVLSSRRREWYTCCSRLRK